MILTLSLLLSSTAFSADIVLTSKSCADLKKEKFALCEWKKSVEPDFVIPAASSNLCIAGKNGTFKIDVENCLPNFTQKYVSTPLARNGPNCWGTAMSFHGNSKKPRFVWPEEIQYWTESPLCRKLNVGEAMAPGDLINVYYPEYLAEAESSQTKDAGIQFWQTLYPGRFAPLTETGYTGYHALLHSVTYVAPNLVFGKDSPAAVDRFFFQPMNQIYGRPGTGEVGGATPEEKACQENQAISPYLREYKNPPKEIRDSKCDYFSNAYRCENLQTHFAQQNLSLPNQAILKNIARLQAIQEKLFPLILSLENKISSAELRSFLSLADETTAKDTILLKQATDKTSEMLLTWEYFTATGIRKTLEQAKLVPGNS